ncbi:MAG: sigma-70 family RNA polymerase sigma factor [Sphingobacteriales bacterium]|nr:sigma-70 family RNA polymerase sigma factor [Sphingobacteriales bacterium]MBI3720749.1 sigma-70 family RNA polymerase sigma factor [Sphingobacteriales bacterium]
MPIQASLVFRLQQKDEQAFAMVYKNYGQALLNVIKKVVNDDGETARDVFQEAMLKIWNNIHTYDAGKGTLFTWMLNVCRNMAIDKTRSKDFKNQSRNQSFDLVSFVQESQNISPNPETIGVNKMLQVLNEDQRQVVNTVYMLGYSHSEAAEKLNLPVGTVKTRLRSAIMELKKQFSEQ